MSNPVAEWKAATAQIEIPVRFAETDLMGVVHHGAYIVWFEVGRIAWMEAAGMPYPEIAASGHHFAVTGITAEYRAATHFGKTVRVITCLQKLRSRQIDFAYEVYDDADMNLLATGISNHICVDLEGRMATIPKAIAKRLLAGVELLAGQPVSSSSEG